MIKYQENLTRESVVGLTRLGHDRAKFLIAHVLRPDQPSHPASSGDGVTPAEATALWFYQLLEDVDLGGTVARRRCILGEVWPFLSRLGPILWPRRRTRATAEARWLVHFLDRRYLLVAGLAPYDLMTDTRVEAPAAPPIERLTYDLVALYRRNRAQLDVPAPATP